MRNVFIFLCAVLPYLPSSGFGADKFADLYFNESNPPALTANEKAGLQLAKEWNADSAKALKPTTGPDGSVHFVFGDSQPGIICAVLQITDVALQPGEMVNSLHFGDTARWLIEPAITGAGSNEVQHLIIKPKDVGLETSLVVATDKRTYHMRLKSTRSAYMPKVSFVYPEDAVSKWEALKAKREVQEQRDLMPSAGAAGEYLGDLDFGYTIDGKAPWKPLRVFSDGTKTIIQMPKEMKSEAPTLLVVRRNGLFTSDDTVMVNYRVQGDRYIVDGLFDQAILIAGVGSGQSKVTISKR